MCIKPIDLTIVSGTSCAITIPPLFLKDGCMTTLEFCLTKPDLVKYRDLLTGTEVVTLTNGVGGTSYVLEDNAADVFYADKLLLGYCYRLRFGNNGPAIQTGQTAGIGHFINLNTPCCSRKYNPANTVIPPIPEATEEA